MLLPCTVGVWMSVRTCGTARDNDLESVQIDRLQDGQEIQCMPKDSC